MKGCQSRESVNSLLVKMFRLNIKDWDCRTQRSPWGNVFQLQSVWCHFHGWQDTGSTFKFFFFFTPYSPRKIICAVRAQWLLKGNKSPLKIGNGWIFMTCLRGFNSRNVTGVSYNGWLGMNAVILMWVRDNPVHERMKLGQSVYLLLISVDDITSTMQATWHSHIICTHMIGWKEIGRGCMKDTKIQTQM